MRHAVPGPRHCAVTRDHVVASGGGLYFENRAEFAACLERLREARANGRSGTPVCPREFRVGLDHSALHAGRVRAARRCHSRYRQVQGKGERQFVDDGLRVRREVQRLRPVQAEKQLHRRLEPRIG